MAQGELALDQIEFNPYQPRKEIDPDELADLRESVKNHGILQPIVVRRVGDQFQLVAGERRMRAAKEAGLSTIPVRMVDFNDQETMEAALVENIQRSDLNAIDKAQGFKDYLDRFQINHEQLAKRLGLARSTITNLVNLLELTPDVQNALRSGQISEGHAKVLKGVKDPERQVVIYRQIVAQGLSVKASEAYVRQLREEGTEEPSSSPKKPKIEKSAHVKSIENELRQQLAVPVDIQLRGEDKGQIVVKFDSNDDFARVLDWFRGERPAA